MAIIPPAILLLRITAVAAMTQLSVRTIYEMVRADQFPAPLKIGPRSSRFVAAEVHAWIDQQVSRRSCTE